MGAGLAFHAQRQGESSLHAPQLLVVRAFSSTIVERDGDFDSDLDVNQRQGELSLHAPQLLVVRVFSSAIVERDGDFDSDLDVDFA